MARRATAEVLARNGRGEKQCVRCEEWLPESAFSENPGRSDGLQSRCKRCVADGQHQLPPGLRLRILVEQDGKCACGYLFDVHGGRNVTYNIDHDHGCCPGRYSCGDCVRALVCRGCNKRDRNNPDRTGSGASKYRGVSWDTERRKWRVIIERGGKKFSPIVIDLPSGYVDEDEASRVAAQLETWLDANSQLWRRAA